MPVVTGKTFGLIAAAAMLLSYGCGGCSPPDLNSAENGGASAVSRMNFRGVPESDPLLGPRFRSAGGYSIRPPAGWTRSALRPAPASLLHHATFTASGTGDFFDTGVIRGGPATTSPDTLNEVRESLANSIRKSGKAQVIGSDLYLFGEAYVIQLLSKSRDTVLLQLLVFVKPGEIIQLNYAVKQERYRATARAIEASIASLETGAARRRL